MFTTSFDRDVPLPPRLTRRNADAASPKVTARVSFVDNVCRIRRKPAVPTEMTGTYDVSTSSRSLKPVRAGSWAQLPTARQID